MKKTSKKAAATVKIVEAVEAAVYYPRKFFREIVTLQDLAEALKDL